MVRWCVFITAGPITKLFAWGGEDSGGHVLRETTSPGLPVCSTLKFVTVTVQPGSKVNVKSFFAKSFVESMRREKLAGVLR